MSPKSNTGVLIKRKTFGVTERHREEGHVMTEAEIGVVATGQEMPRIASHKLRETIKESSLQGQHGSANTLILDW